MSGIFVSYSKNDTGRVSDIVRELKAENFRVWWMQDIPYAENWDDVVDDHLAEASTILVAWSETSVVSQEVKHEAFFALRQRKGFPIRLDKAEPPSRWLRMQTADLTRMPPTANDDWPKVIQALRAREFPATPPEPPGGQAAVAPSVGNPNVTQPEPPRGPNSNRRAAAKPTDIVIPGEFIVPGMLLCLALFSMLGIIIAGIETRFALLLPALIICAALFAAFRSFQRSS